MPREVSDSNLRCVRDLGEFLLQGPISPFVGTFGIGAKYEDVAFAEDLDAGTC
jgi:hypothetical protein